MNQFSLLKSRYFAPYFATQFLGAFNDNLFKYSLLLLIAYSGNWPAETNVNFLINLSAGLFILPFFIFSATAGQLADKYNKSLLIRRLKLFEIVIMSFACIAFYFEQYYLLIVILFFMGLQSALFGPVKYAILPEHLRSEELLAGNALVEMGTFIAILLGTLLGGVLAAIDSGKIWVSLAVLSLAVIGWLSSRNIPTTIPIDPELKIGKNPFMLTWRTIRVVISRRYILIVIVANSWFWFLGAAYLTQLPVFAKEVLYANEYVVTLLLVAFTIGIASGSLLCGRFSSGSVEYRLVSIGLLGLTFFGIDIWLASDFSHVETLRSVEIFFAELSGVRVVFDLVMIGIFGGLFIVPLYTILQSEVAEKDRAQVMAANNIFNALFMVLSALMGMVMLGVLEMKIPELFFVIAGLNIVVLIVVIFNEPRFMFGGASSQRNREKNSL